MSARTLKLAAAYVGIAFINVGIAEAVCSTSNPPDPQNPETADVIFIIDGSGSIDTEFNLQKQGVIESICGTGAFIPADGSVAIAVIQFSDEEKLRVEIELTVVDESNRSELCTCVNNMTQLEGGTELLPALQKAEWIFDNEALGAQRFLVVSTDAYITDDVNSVLQECQDMRTATIPVQICTVLVGCNTCVDCPEIGTYAEQRDFMKDCANSDGRHVGEPIGNFRCAANSDEYEWLCTECMCGTLNAGEPDTDSDGVLDPCDHCDGLAGVVYVDASATGNNDGTSWADAFTNLKTALATPFVVGGPGCLNQIRVADGTYMPDGGRIPVGGSYVAGTGTRSDTFQLINHVTIIGGFAGYGAADPNEWDIVAHETILSGDLNGDDTSGGSNAENSYHVVTGSNTDGSAVLDGFTITSGYANGSVDDGKGGGIYLDEGCPAIVRCTIKDHHANYDGGGVYCDDSSPSFRECTITGNSANSEGGGIYGYGSSPSFSNCAITNNSAPFGGGFYCYGDSPVLTRCTIGGNSAGYHGGGLYFSCGGSDTPELTACTIAGNSADSRGGGIYFYGTSLTVRNCMIVRNSATQSGGGLFSDVNDPEIINCTITENSAASGGGIFVDAGTPTVTNSIVWGNVSTQIVGDATVTYSDLGECSVSEGNISADPQFVDPDGADNNAATWQDNDYHLADGSPCLDVGDNDATSLPTADFEGDDRIRNCRVDIGADESAYLLDCNSNSTADACEIGSGPGLDDCNSNGVIDACDITSGASTDNDTNDVPDECEMDWAKFDYDRDGDVDQSDFAYLQLCLTVGYDLIGDPVSVTCECDNADADRDGDVDGADKDAFALCAAGSAVMPDANCGLGGGMSMPESPGDEILRIEGTTLAMDSDGLLDEPMEPEPTPVACVSASFVLHNSGTSSFNVPVEGGTVVVDLVITTDSPILGWEGIVGVNAANIVSINASDWSDKANVLFSYGFPGYELTSYYNCTLVDWLLIRFADESAVAEPNSWWVGGVLAEGVSIEQGTDPNALLEPLTTASATGYGMDAVAGPIALDYQELFLSDQYGNFFVAANHIGAVAQTVLPAGANTVATLSLQVAGVAGTYDLRFVDGIFVEQSNQLVTSWPLFEETAFQIIVGGQ